MRLESLKFGVLLRGSKPEYNSSTQLQNSWIEKLYIYITHCTISSRAPEKRLTRGSLHSRAKTQ